MADSSDPRQSMRDTPHERFLEAFDAYSDALFRHAELRLSDRDRAIDAVHDTFTKAWSYLKEGHTIDSFKPFLYKVLNNRIIDEYRKDSEASLDTLFDESGLDERSFPELSEDTVESLAATIDGKQALALLSELPPQFREVIVLRFVDELGPKEIAELVEESENTVSVRIHRGLKQLRTRIEAEEAARQVRRRNRPQTP